MSPLHVLVLLGATNLLAHDGARFTVLLYSIQLGASPAVVGLLGGLFALVPALTSIGVGKWIDRVGPRKPMLASAAVMVAGLAVSFVWRNLAALFITSVLVGSFYNIFFVAANKLVGQLGRPGEHVHNVSVSSTGYSFAIFLAPLTAGFTIDGWGHANTFLLLAALPLLPCVVIGLGGLHIPGAATPAAKAESPEAPGLLVLLRGKTLQHIFIASLIGQVAWTLYIFLMPLYGSQIGMSASRIGIVMGAFSLTTVLVRSALSVFVRTLTAWQVLLLALSGASVILFGFPFFSSYAALMVLGVVLGICLGLGGPMALSLLYDTTPSSRLGAVLGMRITIMNTCFTAVPLLSGTITAVVGLAPVFWLLSVMVGAGCYAMKNHWHDARPGSAKREA